jgi:hypothetical protein
MGSTTPTFQWNEKESLLTLRKFELTNTGTQTGVDCMFVAQLTRLVMSVSLEDAGLTMICLEAFCPPRGCVHRFLQHRDSLQPERQAPLNNTQAIFDFLARYEDIQTVVVSYLLGCNNLTQWARSLTHHMIRHYPATLLLSRVECARLMHKLQRELQVQFPMMRCVPITNSTLVALRLFTQQVHKARTRERCPLYRSKCGRSKKNTLDLLSSVDAHEHAAGYTVTWCLLRMFTNFWSYNTAYCACGVSVSLEPNVRTLRALCLFVVKHGVPLPQETAERAAKAVQKHKRRINNARHDEEQEKKIRRELDVA